MAFTTGVTVQHSEEKGGLLCIKAPWLGKARTIFGDHDRFTQTFFCFDGYCCSATVAGMTPMGTTGSLGASMT